MTDSSTASPSRMSCSASTSWSDRPATSAAVLASITSAADSLQIRLFGRGAHGSMPQASIDPVVMAAATVMRLQTIVSRELAAAEAAVVTIGSLQAGTKENVIPDEAIIKLNVRTFDAGVRKRVLAAIERIVNAEAAASGAPRPPEITHARSLSPGGQRCGRERARRRGFPPAFRRRPRAARPGRRRPARISDRSEPSGSVPSVFWFVGGTDPDRLREGQGGGPSSTRFRPTTIRTLRRSCIRPWRPAWRRWSSARWPGCRHRAASGRD